MFGQERLFIFFERENGLLKGKDKQRAIWRSQDIALENAFDFMQDQEVNQSIYDKSEEYYSGYTRKKSFKSFSEYSLRYLALANARRDIFVFLCSENRLPDNIFKIYLEVYRKQLTSRHVIRRLDNLQVSNSYPDKPYFEVK